MVSSHFLLKLLLTELISYLTRWKNLFVLLSYQNFTCNAIKCEYCIKALSFQGTSVLSPIIPFSLVVVPAFIIYRKSAENVYETHPALYILAFGMVAAKVTNRLVVSLIEKMQFWKCWYSFYLSIIWKINYLGCSHDEEWNGVLRYCSHWTLYVIPQSVLQFFHYGVLCTVVVLCKYSWL